MAKLNLKGYDFIWLKKKNRPSILFIPSDSTITLRDLGLPNILETKAGKEGTLVMIGEVG